MPEHGRVPKYYTVKAQLVGLIAELGVGALLPAERDLAATYGVARSTLRQAISELIIEGRLRAHRGRGTFVAAPKLIQPLALVSYTEALREMGHQPGRVLVTLERVSADAELAGHLAIAEGAEVIHLERVLLADGEPLGLESTYLSYQRYPTLPEVLEPTGSLYQCMEQRLGVVYAEATERVETVLASPREALLLRGNPALPMLLMQRVSLDQQGIPIERVRALYRGDRIGFETRLRAG
ncbi:GntR family transcriptional regulator [Rugosimonospora acidiphila]|uniref:GntR family transcriptional regulator n=1 Tax=Rugosimonospora acidiphila TaxID=556531 RepID=A0ABP9RWA2_9ACTN